MLYHPGWSTAGYLSWPRTDASRLHQAAGSAGLLQLAAASKDDHSGSVLSKRRQARQRDWI